MNTQTVDEAYNSDHALTWGEAHTVIVGLAAISFLVAAAAWGHNLWTILHSVNDPTAFLMVRCLGVPLIPLGVILGLV